MKADETRHREGKSQDLSYLQGLQLFPCNRLLKHSRVKAHFALPLWFRYDTTQPSSVTNLLQRNSSHQFHGYKLTRP